MSFLSVCGLLYSFILTLPITALTHSGYHGNEDNNACSSLCACADTRTGQLYVNCSSGGLTTIPYDIPEYTSILDAQANMIASIEKSDFDQISALRRLYLQGNVISEIQPWTFDNHHQLEYIDLSRNKLREIAPHMFANLVSLRLLRLDGNNIVQIDPRSFLLTRLLGEISMSGNPLHCDCSIKYLRDALSSGTFITGARCDNFDNTALERISDDELGICPGVGGLMCSTCERATSIQECIQQGSHSRCGSYEVCGLSLEIYGGLADIRMSCQSPDHCYENLVYQPETCVGGEDQICHFCCAKENCNAHTDLSGFEFDASLFLNFTLDRKFDQSLANQSSELFQNLSSELTTKLEEMFNDWNYSVVASVTEFSAGSIICDMTLLVTYSLGDDLVDLAVNLYDILMFELENGMLDLEILPDSVQLTAGTSTGYCPQDTISDQYGTVQWPLTEVKDVSILKCPLPKNGAIDETAQRLCILHPSGNAVWGEPDMTNCAVMRQVTDDLQDLIKQPVTNESIEGIAEALSNLTGGANSYTEEELELTVQLLDSLVSPVNATNTEASVAVIVASINNLFDVDDDVVTSGEAHTQAASRMLKGIDDVSSNLVLASPNLTLVEKHLAVSVVALKSSITGGASFSISSDGEDQSLRDKDIMLEVNTSSVVTSQVESSISLPGEAFLHVTDRNRLQFAAFDNAKFFNAIVKAGNGSLGPARNDTLWALNSKVISASIQGVEVDDLKHAIVITLRHIEQNATEPSCVFWSYDVTGSVGGGWEETGCEVGEHYPGNYTVCYCDHLTSFALIMDIYGKGGSISYENRVALSVISYVGCAVSLCALLITLLSYAIFRKQSRTKPAQILINLCVALFCMLLLFILATQSFTRQNDIGCKVAAGLLHFFMLVTWFWMLVEAVYMYLALIKVFNTYYSHFMLKCCLFSWGLPAVIVGVVVAISRDNYGQQGEICWLDRVPFFAACLAPIVLILVINFVVFGLVMYQLCKYNNSLTPAKLDKHQRANTVGQLRGALSITVLLGLTWVFAIFAVGEASLVFSYLFAIFNSLQGLFIFIFYCLLKKDMQKAWRQKFYSESKTMTSSTGKPTPVKTSTNASSGNKPYQELIANNDATKFPVNQKNNLQGQSEGEIFITEDRTDDQTSCDPRYDSRL